MSKQIQVTQADFSQPITELFQPITDKQAESVKGGGKHTYQYSDYCNRTGKNMQKTATVYW